MRTTTHLSRRAGVLLLGLGLALTVSGCRERVCVEEEYPVTNDAGGGACVPDGQEPPEGWERYPAGKTPTYVDEMYPDQS